MPGGTHMLILRCFTLGLFVTVAGLLASGCSSPTPPTGQQSAGETSGGTAAKAGDEAHGHTPGAHGGTLVSLGRDSYHAEAVFEKGGHVRLYMLGKDEARIQEVEAQELTAYITADGSTDSDTMTLRPEPQPGDAAGKTSQFVATLPKDAVGKTVRVTVNNLNVGGERFRIAFSNAAAAPHPDQMPEKRGTDEERALFLAPGGAYTAADIAANGSTIPAAKYKGVRAQHDDNPKAGDKVCPISKTKANPKFTWVVGGKTYEFCCVPCIEEFVAIAKEKPGEIKDPKDYVKQ
jgi:YHS domain-containing protein